MGILALNADERIQNVYFSDFDAPLPESID